MKIHLRRRIATANSRHYLAIEALEPRRVFFHTYLADGDPNAILSSQTVTYSYSNLIEGFANFTGLGNADVIAATQEAMGIWAATTGLQFEQRADSGPAPSDALYPRDSHPIIRWGHHPIDGNRGVNTLAHAYPPGLNDRNSDVHFDSGNTFNIGEFLEVAAHELGHAIGMSHANGDVVAGVCPTSTGALMDACMNGSFAGLGDATLQFDDAIGILGLYDYAGQLGYVLTQSGELHVYGTSSDDTMVANVSGGTVTISSTQFGIFTKSLTRSTAGLSSIVMHGQRGNDILRIENNDIHLPISMMGGTGDDTMHLQSVHRDFDLAAGNVFVVGGPGSDSLIAHDRNDGGGRTYTVSDRSISSLARGTALVMAYESVESVQLITGLIHRTTVIQNATRQLDSFPQVVIDTYLGTNTISIDDSGHGFGDHYRLTEDRLTSTRLGDRFLFPSLSQSTVARIGLTTGSGDDVVELHGNARRIELLPLVSLEVGGGRDTMILNDTASGRTTDRYRVTETNTLVDGIARATYNTSLEHLRLLSAFDLGNNVGGRLFFTSHSPDTGRELHVHHDNTTTLVRDIWPAPNSSDIREITDVNGTAYFFANNGVDGAELWKIDGTASGTVRVRDILPGLDSSYPGELTNVNGTLFLLQTIQCGGANCGSPMAPRQGRSSMPTWERWSLALRHNR